MKSKHKPCPFCGSNEMGIKAGENWVTCLKCGTYGPTPKFNPPSTTQRAIQVAMIWDAWDTRDSKEVITHTPGPWFVRYCDDDSSMCMTTVGSKDWGPANTTKFGDEEDTVAIVYHQCFPLVMVDELDIADANARLIAAAPAMFEILETLKFSIEDENTAFSIHNILKAVRGKDEHL